MNGTWRVVVAEPGKKAEVKTIPATYEALKKLVGGPVETTHPLTDDTAVLCNEVGKLIDLPMNRVMYDHSGNPADVYCGPIVCIGSRKDRVDFTSLTDIEAAIYMMLYDDPDFTESDECEEDDNE